MPTQFYTLYPIMSSFAFQSQLFEQCQRDINRTKAIDVVKKPFEKKNGNVQQ